MPYCAGACAKWCLDPITRATENLIGLCPLLGLDLEIKVDRDVGVAALTLTVLCALSCFWDATSCEMFTDLGCRGLRSRELNAVIFLKRLDAWSRLCVSEFMSCGSYRLERLKLRGMNLSAVSVSYNVTIYAM